MRCHLYVSRLAAPAGGTDLVLIQPAVEPVVEAFSVARRERILDCELVVPAGVGGLEL